MWDRRILFVRNMTDETNHVWKEASLSAFSHGLGWMGDVFDIVDALGA